jgi:cell division protein FtsL
MIDWAQGIRYRNYSIRRQPDSRAQRELIWIVLSIAVVAGVLFLHSWVRNRIVYVGYMEQRLQEEEKQLLRVQKALNLEEQTLKDLARIDLIARNDLKMTPVRPSQVLPSQYQDFPAQDGTVLALANAPQSSSESRGLPATN